MNQSQPINVGLAHSRALKTRRMILGKPYQGLEPLAWGEAWADRKSGDYISVLDGAATGTVRHLKRRSQGLHPFANREQTEFG